jgi:monoamine oxidase
MTDGHTVVDCARHGHLPSLFGCLGSLALVLNIARWWMGQTVSASEDTMTSVVAAPAAVRADEGIMYDVVIVGAGVAGMSTAQKLMEQGKSVVLIEARDRCGGRVQPVDVKGTRVDLGAQFIHGVSKPNPLMQLLNGLGQGHKVHKVDWDDGYYYKGDGAAGEVPDGKLGQSYKLSEKALNTVRSKRGSIYKKQTREADLSLGEELRGVVAAMKSKNKSMDSELVMLCAQMEISDDYAADLDELSLCYWDQDDEFNGCDGIIRKEGYAPLLAALSKGLNIVLNQPVASIQQVSAKDGHHEGVCVTCSSGAQFRGQQVVCTLPLGVLKSRTVRFDPALPPSLAESVDRLGVGNLEKLVIKFKQPFWPNDSDCFFNLSGNPFRLWLNVGNCYGHGDRTMLLCFVAGSYARSLMSSASDDDIINLGLGSLREIFGSSRIPTDTVRAMSLVDTARVTRWCTDPWSQGSYSHMPRGSLPADYDAFGKRYWDGRLHFAGEGTFRKFPGTVHGALLSGERAARNCAGGGAPRKKKA